MGLDEGTHHLRPNYEFENSSALSIPPVQYTELSSGYRPRKLHVS